MTSAPKKKQASRRWRGSVDLQQLFETAPFLLVRIGFDGHLKQVNPAWAVLGWSEAELLGRPWASFLIHPDDLVRTEQAVVAMMSGSGVVEFEQRLMCKDGSWRWFSCSGRPSEEEAVFYGIAIDITERKRAEAALEDRTAQLEAVNKELEAFTYSASHDLRAPLRALDGFSRILLEDYGPQLPPAGRQYLELVRGNAQQMGRLVDDLLTFSRLGRQPVNKQRVDPAALVQQALEDLASAQEGRQVDVRVEALPACEADPGLLKQVWLNLLDNALKYTRTRDPARIAVGAIQGEGMPAYYVKDNGVGFDMQYADRLFAVFQRLHGQEEFEGTGVGLAIVERIVHRHGGRVWAEAAVDQGATLYFTLG